MAREWPLRKVVSRAFVAYKGDEEKLECGHTLLVVGRMQKTHPHSRRCSDCWEEREAKETVSFT